MQGVDKQLFGFEPITAGHDAPFERTTRQLLDVCIVRFTAGSGSSGNLIPEAAARGHVYG
jgi:hypothetical protein